ncbi:hypothetical protein HOY82DRAFT_114911 [Tuber indicum]|nr:hypothetical protein HOY82DRAFT_114911 [Tuber indicum]
MARLLARAVSKQHLGPYSPQPRWVVARLRCWCLRFAHPSSLSLQARARKRNSCFSCFEEISGFALHYLGRLSFLQILHYSAVVPSHTQGFIITITIIIRTNQGRMPVEVFCWYGTCVYGLCHDIPVLYPILVLYEY